MLDLRLKKPLSGFLHSQCFEEITSSPWVEGAILIGSL